MTPLMWDRFGEDLRRRRDRARLTQDALAARVGVRWNTIARLETGRRRPSIDLLEKLAGALNCRVRDLIPEEEPVKTIEKGQQREPTLRGAPSFFRFKVSEAAERKVIGRDMNSGRTARADYADAGWHLAIHAHEYLEEAALTDLADVAKLSGEQLDAALLAFFDREFPGCMALIPRGRRRQFLSGVLRAIKDGRFEF